MTKKCQNKLKPKGIILAQRGDKPLFASDSHRRFVLTFEIKLYTVFPRFGTYQQNEEKSRCIDFQEKSTKSKLKGANTKIYL